MAGFVFGLFCFLFLCVPHKTDHRCGAEGQEGKPQDQVSAVAGLGGICCCGDVFLFGDRYSDGGRIAAGIGDPHDLLLIGGLQGVAAVGVGCQGLSVHSDASQLVIVGNGETGIALIGLTQFEIVPPVITHVP